MIFHTFQLHWLLCHLLFSHRNSYAFVKTGRHYILFYLPAYLIFYILQSVCPLLGTCGLKCAFATLIISPEVSGAADPMLQLTWFNLKKSE